MEVPSDVHNVHNRSNYNHIDVLSSMPPAAVPSATHHHRRHRLPFKLPSKWKRPFKMLNLSLGRHKKKSSPPPLPLPAATAAPMITTAPVPPEMSSMTSQRAYSQASTTSRGTTNAEEVIASNLPSQPLSSPQTEKSRKRALPSTSTSSSTSTTSAAVFTRLFGSCLPTCMNCKPISSIRQKIRTRRSSEHTLFGRYLRSSKSASTTISAVNTPSQLTLRLLPSRYTLRGWRRRSQPLNNHNNGGRPLYVIDLVTPEIWRLILHYLDGRTAARLSRASRYFRELIINDQQLWRQLYLCEYTQRDDTEKELLRWTIAHSDDHPHHSLAVDSPLAAVLLSPDDQEQVNENGPATTSATTAAATPPPRLTLEWPSHLSDDVLATTHGNWCRRFTRRARLEWRWRHHQSMSRQLNLADSPSRQLRARPIAAGAWGTLLCLQDNDKGQGQLLFILVPTEPMQLPTLGQHDPLHVTNSTPPDLLLLNGPRFNDLDHPMINGRFIATCGNTQLDPCMDEQEFVPPGRHLIVWRIGQTNPVYRVKVSTYAQVADIRDAWLLLRERTSLHSTWQYTLHHLDSGQSSSRSFTASFGCHIQRTTRNSALVFCARLLDSTTTTGTAATTTAAGGNNNSTTANVVSWTDEGHCIWQLLRFQLVVPTDIDGPNDDDAGITMRVTGEGSSLTVVGRGRNTGRRRTVRHDDNHAVLVEVGVSLDDPTALEVTLLDICQSRVLRRERFTSTAGMSGSAAIAANLGPDGNDVLLDISPWQLASPLRSPPMHHLFSRGVVDRRYRPLVTDDTAIQLNTRILGRLHIHYERPLPRSSNPVEHVDALCIFDAHTMLASLMNEREEHGMDGNNRATPSYGYYPGQICDMPRRVARLRLLNHVLLRHLVTSPVHLAYLQPEYALLQILQFA
ncbi:hypothetical protein BDF22DRAFT_667298 [Syncephalis plumigaleata]|nr:hypothetical protein BDF22DRAFT_667298 [Syncephalis plumigaleata]